MIKNEELDEQLKMVSAENEFLSQQLANAEKLVFLIIMYEQLFNNVTPVLLLQSTVFYFLYLYRHCLCLFLLIVL